MREEPERGGETLLQIGLGMLGVAIGVLWAHLWVLLSNRPIQEAVFPPFFFGLLLSLGAFVRQHIVFHRWMRAHYPEWRN